MIVPTLRVGTPPWRFSAQSQTTLERRDDEEL